MCTMSLLFIIGLFVWLRSLFWNCQRENINFLDEFDIFLLD
jgi:hypothetical protein